MQCVEEIRSSPPLGCRRVDWRQRSTKRHLVLQTSKLLYVDRVRYIVPDIDPESSAGHSTTYEQATRTSCQHRLVSSMDRELCGSLETVVHNILLCDKSCFSQIENVRRELNTRSRTDERQLLFDLFVWRFDFSFSRVMFAWPQLLG